MPRKKFKFNERWLARLAPPTEEKQAEWWDSVVPGLHVIVYRSGRKTYFLRHRGRRTRLGEVVGEGPDATRRLIEGETTPLDEIRDRARELRKSPVQTIAARARGIKTVKDIYDRWLVEKAPEYKPKTLREYRRSLEREVLPLFGDSPVAELLPEMLLGWIESIGDKPPKGRGKPTQANRCKSHLSTVFSWAQSRLLIPSNPLEKVTWRYDENPTPVVYSSEEIKTLWEDWEQVQGVTGSFFRLILCTVQRPGEVLEMRWDRVDTVAGSRVWVIEDPKNKTRHYVPLETLAVETLEKLHPLTGTRGKWVFPHRSKFDAPMNSWNSEVMRCRTRTGIQHFKPHKLRGTGASWMETLGVPIPIVQALLNHTPGGATSSYVYSQGASPACRSALQTLEGHLLECIEGTYRELSFAAVLRS